MDLMAAEKSTNVRTSSDPAARPAGPSASQQAVLAALHLLDQLSSTLAARAAERLFVRPRRHPRPRRERELLLDAARRFRIRYRGLSLRAWEWGEGPPVLLVHGWEGRGAQLGALIGPLTRAGLRVIAYDGPAHGASPGSETTLVDLAGAAGAALDSIGPVAGIVAHSMGAAAATISLARGAEAERAVYLAPVAHVAAAVDRFFDLIELSPPARAVFLRRLSERTQTGFETIEGGVLAPRMRAGLLVIHDQADREVPPADGDLLAAAWPGAGILRTAGLGHHRILRDAAIVDTVVGFLVAGRPGLRTPQEQLDRELFQPDLRA